MKNLVLILIIFLSIISCNNKEEKNNHDSSDQQKEVMKKEEIDYLKYGISEENIAGLQPLKIGSLAPDFSGKDQNDQEISLSKLTEKGDVILIFYRGHWCPYCSKHLNSFTDQLKNIQDKGVSLIAVAPEGSKNIGEMNKISKLDIPFISDPDNKIMNLYGVTFKVNEIYNNKFSNWKGVSLAQNNGQDEATLPIPATYIIDKNQKIKWVHFDPDYSQRSKVEDILLQL